MVPAVSIFFFFSGTEDAQRNKVPLAAFLGHPIPLHLPTGDLSSSINFSYTKKRNISHSLFHGPWFRVRSSHFGENRQWRGNWRKWLLTRFQSRVAGWREMCFALGPPFTVADGSCLCTAYETCLAWGPPWACYMSDFFAQGEVEEGSKGMVCIWAKAKAGKKSRRWGEIRHCTFSCLCRSPEQRKG